MNPTVNSYSMHKPLLYELPKYLSKLLGASIVTTPSGYLLIGYDSDCLYSYLLNTGSNPLPTILLKYNIPSLKYIITLNNAYFGLVTKTSQVSVFQANIINGKADFTIILDCRYFKSYFVRETVQNIVELQIFWSDCELLVLQFTSNHKLGSIYFSMTPQYKIKAAKRKHLYGSKSFFNVARKAIYSLKNYSDEQFTVFGIGNLEKNFGKKNGALCISYHYLFYKFYEYVGVFDTLTVSNCENTEGRHFISFNGLESPGVHKDNIQYFLKSDNKKEDSKVVGLMDLLLIADQTREIAYVFQIKPNASMLVGVYYGKFNWFWASGRRLIGLHPERSYVRFFKLVMPNYRTKNIASTVPITKSLNDLQVNPKKSKFIYKLAISQTYSETRYNGKLTDIFLYKTSSQKYNDPLSQYNSLKIYYPPLVIVSKSKYLLKSFDDYYPLNNKLKNQIYKPPTKIIQRNKTSVSKTIQKAKYLVPSPILSVNIIEYNIEEKKLDTQKIEYTEEYKKREEKERLEYEVEILKVLTRYPIVHVEKEIVKEEGEVVSYSESSESIYSINEITNPKNQSFSSYGRTANLSKIDFLDEPAQYSLNLFNTSIKRDKLFSHSTIPQYQKPITEEIKCSNNNYQEQQIDKIELTREYQRYKTIENTYKEEERETFIKGSYNSPKTIYLASEKGDYYLLVSAIQSYTSKIKNYNEKNPFLAALLPIASYIVKESTLPACWLKKHLYNRSIYSQTVPTDQPTHYQIVTIIDDNKTMSRKEILEHYQQFQMILRYKFDQSAVVLQKQIETMALSVEVNHYIFENIYKKLTENICESIKQFVTKNVPYKLYYYFKQFTTLKDYVLTKSLYFYKQNFKNKLGSLQTQYDNQEDQIRYIDEIRGIVQKSMQNVIEDSEECCLGLLTEWKKTSVQVQKSVDSFSERCDKQEAQETARNAKLEYIKDSLQEIKEGMRNLLKHKVEARQYKQNQKIQRKRREQEVLENKKVKKDQKTKIKSNKYEIIKAKRKNSHRKY